MMFHKILMEELEQILKTVTDLTPYQKVIDLLRNKAYAQALLEGCKNASPDNKTLTMILELIIAYAKILNIKLNTTDNSGNTPIYYVMRNQNSSLYLRLRHTEAKISDDDKQQWEAQEKARITELETKFDVKYKESSSRLLSSWRELSAQSAVADKSAEKDKSRIDYICSVLSHITTYYVDLNNHLVITSDVNSAEKERLYDQHIWYLRIFIYHMALAASWLSTPLREQYQEFDWFAFAKLGGILKPLTEATFFTIPQPSDVEATMDVYALYNFQRELRDTERLKNEAAISLLADLPALKQFFTTVASRQNHRDSTEEIRTVVLPIIQIIIRHFNENQFLIELLNLLNYEEKTSPLKVSSEILRKPNPNHISKDDLATSIGKHAFLQLCQRLGEAFTTKNTRLPDFDNTIDFQAFIKLRNIITHQDIEHFKHAIDGILKEDDDLQAIFAHDLPELFRRLFQLISFRHQKFGGYHGDAVNYWSKVLKINQEREQFQNQALPEIIPVGPASIRAVDDEDRLAIMQCFDELLSIIEKDETEKTNVVALKEEFADILDGHKTIDKAIDAVIKDSLLRTVVNTIKDKEKPADTETAEIGGLFSMFEEADTTTHAATTMEPGTTSEPTAQVGKNDSIKVVFDRLRDLLAMAFSEEKEQLTTHENINAVKLYTGLDTLRLLPQKIIKQPNPAQYALTKLGRIRAASQALSTIYHFLADAGFLQRDPLFGITSYFKRPSAHDMRLKKQDLQSLLLSNRILNNALEYNVGQFLLHLHALRKYLRFREEGRDILDTNYDHLRTLRNYIEHGNPLIVSSDYAHSKYFGVRQNIIADFLVSLAFQNKWTRVLRELETLIHRDSLYSKSPDRTPFQFTTTTDKTVSFDPPVRKSTPSWSQRLERAIPRHQKQPKPPTASKQETFFFSAASFKFKPETDNTVSFAPPAGQSRPSLSQPKPGSQKQPGPPTEPKQKTFFFNAASFKQTDFKNWELEETKPKSPEAPTNQVITNPAAAAAAPPTFFHFDFSWCTPPSTNPAETPIPPPSPTDGNRGPVPGSDL